MKPISSVVLLATTPLSLTFLASCRSGQTPQPAESRLEYAKEAVFPKIEGLNLGTYERPKDFKFTIEEGQKLLNRLTDLSQSQTKFTVNEEVRLDGETWFSSPQDPSAVARINQRNGDLMFNEGMVNYRGDKATPALLPGPAAQQRAREYLKQLELPLKENELVVAHVGGVNLGLHEGDRTEVLEKFSLVRFDRQLDGIPVFGHSRVVLQLAEQGRLNAFVWQWSPFAKRDVAKEALRATPDDMKTQLEGAVLGENTEAAKIRIESIQLVYFDDGRGAIEPAIRVKGKTTPAGKHRVQEFPYDTVVPLLKSPQANYPFRHRVEKQPNETDDTKQMPEIPRSADDREKY